MGPKKMIIIIITISLVLVIMPCVVEAADNEEQTYKVGGSNHSWAPADDSFSFSFWAKEIEFHLRDWLLFEIEVFEYNQSLSVLIVNETDYLSCRSEDPIQNITGGTGHDLFQLTSKQTYYFISGGGYCTQGVSVSVKVVDFSYKPGIRDPSKFNLHFGHRKRSTLYIVLDVVIAVSVTVTVAVSIIGWRIYRQRNIS